MCIRDRFDTTFFENLARDSYYKTIYNTQRQTGYGFAFSNISEKEIAHALSINWSGEHYSKRIWKNTQDLAETIKEEMVISLLTGRTDRETAQTFEKTFHTCLLYTSSKNGWHVHLVINRIPDTDLILRKAWKKGKIICQLTYEKGEFKDLAAYLTKTPETDKRLRETSYSTSRNLPLPEPKKKTYVRWKTWNKIRIPKGYYLDEESVHEGNNPFTGYPYREYTLLKLKRRE